MYSIHCDVVWDLVAPARRVALMPLQTEMYDKCSNMRMNVISLLACLLGITCCEGIGQSHVYTETSVQPALDDFACHKWPTG